MRGRLNIFCFSYLLFLGGISCFFIPAVAQENITYQISGHLEADGASASRASVVLQFVHEQQLAYAITDSTGRFSFRGMLHGPDTAICIARFLGYAADTALIFVPHSGSYTVQFHLKPKSFTLPEVVISFPTGEQDTLRYDIRSALGKRDFYISDLINEIPGLSVDPSGKVYYNNREIKALLINGVDLLKSNYPLLTKNIRATTFDTLELIKDYHPQPLTKGLYLSHDVALNLVTHRKLTGSASLLASLGSSGTYKTEVNGFEILQPFQLFEYVQANHAGESYEISNSNSSTTIDASLVGTNTLPFQNSFLPSLKPDKPISALSPGNPDVPYDPYKLNNRDASWGMSSSVQINPHQQLIIQYDGQHEHHVFAQTDSSFYVLPQNLSWNITEHEHFNQQLNFHQVSAKWKLESAKKYTGETGYTFASHQPLHRNRVLSTGYLTDTLLENLQDKWFSHQFYTHHDYRINDKNLLNAQLDYETDQLHQQYLLQTQRLKGLIDTISQSHDYLQQLYRNMHQANISLSWLHGNKSSNTTFTLTHSRFQDHDEHLISSPEIPQTHAIQQYNGFKGYLSSANFLYKHDRGLFKGWSVQAGIGYSHLQVQAAKNHVFLYHFSGDYRWQNLVPAKHRWLRLSGLKANLEYKEQPFDTRFLMPDSVITTGFILKNGLHQWRKTAVLSAAIFPEFSFKPLNLHVNVLLLGSWLPRTTVWQYQQDPAYSILSPVQANNAWNDMIGLNTQKTFFSISSKIFYSLQFSYSDQPYDLNGKWYHTQSRIWSHRFTYQWIPSLPFLVEASINDQQFSNHLHAGNTENAYRSAFQKITGYVKFALHIEGVCTGNLVYNYIHTARLPAFHTLDISVDYRPRKNIELSLYGNNLLGHHQLAYHYLEANYASWTTYELVNRFVMLGIKYGF